MSLKEKTAIFKKPVKFVLGKAISVGVKIVDKCVPDRVLLFFMNSLDKRATPKTVDNVANGVDKLVHPKVLSSLITAADEYVPDTVASSRKVSAVIAAVGKYVPSRIIPSESTEDWSKLKTRFHIPTLLTRKDKDKSHED